MQKQYSFKIGLSKALIAILIAVGSLVTIAGVTDLTLWDLCVKYLQPVLSGLTVGGFLTIIVNWIKFKSSL
jgi:hypothetical protein